MKKKLLSLRILSSTALVFVCSNVSFGQQIIGEFNNMDGGFEATVTPLTLTNTSTSSSWAISSTSSTTKSIETDAAIARSGKNYAKFTSNAGGNSRLQSPTVTTMVTGATYTVQYYVKTAANSPFSILSGSINSTTSSNANSTFTPSTYATDTWIKATATFAAPTIGTSAYANARLNGTSTTYTDLINIDDFVVYAGNLDETAPDAPSAPIVSGLDVSWTAPITGVDGGGYVVVRYATSPNPDNDPKQNGIYNVGNTLTDGTGSLLGTVVYIGTATSFTDGVAGSVSGSDFYKVYAVDKAFNYSNEGGTLKNNQWSLKNPINVYPNPIKDNQFSILLPASISGKVAVSVYNIAGQLVYKSHTTAASNTIAVHPTQSLKSGVYVVKVENNGNSSTQKITVR